MWRGGLRFAGPDLSLAPREMTVDGITSLGMTASACRICQALGAWSVPLAVTGRRNRGVIGLPAQALGYQSVYVYGGLGRRSYNTGHLEA
jgi:hypothetical protein